MKAEQAYVEFLTRIDKINNDIIDVPSDDVFMFINNAVFAFVENVWTAFEKDQQRIDDIQKLVVNETIAVTNNVITLPNDYLHFVKFIVNDNGCLITSYEQVTHGELQHALLDPFKRPTTSSLLFVIRDNKIVLESVRPITSVILTYVKKPLYLKINPNIKQFADVTYTDTLVLDSNKILDIAVRMYVNSKTNDYDVKVNERKENF
jgi:hypothetical protein